jgi:hypothetical protein
MFISLDNVDSVDKNIYVWKKGLDVGQQLINPIAILSFIACILRLIMEN